MFCSSILKPEVGSFKRPEIVPQLQGSSVLLSLSINGLWQNRVEIEFLRAGGNQFTLKEMLGHTTLDMTNKYVALAKADIQNQHRLYSQGDRVKIQERRVNMVRKTRLI
ncbi:MAG: hypothetical protein EOP04_29660 [Proteobacteria bacterium]|nr:MAG: hypothetical protein EOP04_29660 [Pseudomonadota bacterium]